MDQDPSMDQFWSFWIWRPRYSGVLTQFGCLWYFHTNEKLCVQEIGDPQDSRHLVASWQFFIAQLDYWKARQRVPLFRMFQKGITHRTPKEVPTCSNLFLSQICGLKESKSKPVEISFPKHGGTPKFHSDLLGPPCSSAVSVLRIPCLHQLCEENKRGGVREKGLSEWLLAEQPASVKPHFLLLTECQPQKSGHCMNGSWTGGFPGVKLPTGSIQQCLFVECMYFSKPGGKCVLKCSLCAFDFDITQVC